jgi:pimeloyl-ACP methyl ester carboxylesterase
VLAANTKKLLDTLGVHRAAIVGHSFGGMLAIYFARTYPDITLRWRSKIQSDWKTTAARSRRSPSRHFLQPRWRKLQTAIEPS